ncbi:MAG: hypothetical protein NVSMB18_03800 [Acetobacteraceae bacterium]
MRRRLPIELSGNAIDPVPVVSGEARRPELELPLGADALPVSTPGRLVPITPADTGAGKAMLPVS